ncbi:MAG: hypothetical protein QOE59_968, partial [Actinomycetota bacterium]|nr:hypothetical protein [Actinomycetota bacterium]
MAGIRAGRPLAGGVAALATALVVAPSALAGPSGASGATGGSAVPPEGGRVTVPFWV